MIQTHSHKKAPTWACLHFPIVEEEGDDNGKNETEGCVEGWVKTKLEEVYRSVQHPNRTIAVLFGDITTKAVAALPGPNRARERPRATNNSSWCIYGRGAKVY